jgi:ParB/RepB/Spo0J family partition protein
MSRADPSRCRIWPGNTREFDPARSARLVELEALIETQGQLVPAVGRLAEDGTIEIVDGARRLTAINNLLARGVVVDFYVELRDLDDEQAFLVSTGANEGREGFTATERARSYRYMLDSGAFASEVELAAALGIDKSNVNRTLDVLELPETLTCRIIDPHAISARQASRFMSVWRDPDHQGMLAAHVRDLVPGSAARIFKLLHQVISPPEVEPNRIVTEEGVDCGHLRVMRDRSILVTLAPPTGQISLRHVVDAIGQALKALRNQQ